MGEAHHAEEPSDWGPAPHVLLVEDNPLHVRLVRTMLDEAWPGYEELAHVTHLEDAVAYATQAHPDCILLDLMLPDAEGLEAVNGLLAAAPEVPIVVLSAHDDEQAAMQAVKEGAQDYLVKGTVGAEALVKSIRFAIQRHRQANEEGLLSTPLERIDDPSVGEGVAVMGRDGRIMFADATVAEMMGRDFESLIGLGIDRLAHPSDLDAWRAALEAGIAGRLQTRFHHQSGVELRVDVELVPLFDRSGGAGAYIATYTPRPQEGTASSGGTYVVMSGWG